MPDLKGYNYIYIVSAVKVPMKAGGVIAIDAGATLNGTPKPARTAGGSIEMVADVSFTRSRNPHYILHGIADIWRDYSSGVPTATRLVHGLDGRTVPWGVLQEAVEVEDSDVKTWTATSGVNVGKTVGVSLENPRTSVSLTAIFLHGIAPPSRGSIFFFRLGNNNLGRLICLKVTRQWSNEAFYAVQIEGTQWEGSLTRLG